MSTVTGGFRELDPGKLSAAIDRSLDTVGIFLEGEVVSRANENVDTGRHKGSITWKTKHTGSGIGNPAESSDEMSTPEHDHEVAIGTAVEYAPYLEYGHKTPDGGFVPPYPHFRSAFDENKDRVVELFKTAFRRFVGNAKNNR